MHPKPFGNRINANLISNLLDQVDAPFVAKAIPPYDLPAQLDPHSYTNPQFLLPDAASGGVVHQPDWDKLKGGKRKRFVGVDMHCLTEKGQRCELAFEGKTVGAFVVAGPDAGIVDVFIDDKKSGEVNLRHHYSKGLHYPRSVIFASELPPGKHQLRLVMSDRGTGQAMRVLRWAVN